MLKPIVILAAAICLLVPIFTNAVPTPPESLPQTYAIEERQGPSAMFQQLFSGVIGSLFGLMTGSSSISDVRVQIQNLIDMIMRTFNIANMVKYVPVFGGLVNPLVQGMSSNFENLPLFGRMIATTLAGPGPSQDYGAGTAVGGGPVSINAGAA